MPRGGERSPRGGPTVPNVGRFSTRSDGQNVVAPPVSASTPKDMPTGSGKALTEAQRTIPLAADRPATGMAAPPLGDLMGGGDEQLPPWLIEKESGRAAEPPTAGLAIGEGPGPEILSTRMQPSNDAETVLQFLADQFGDADADQMLQEMRASAMPGPPVAAPPSPMEEAPADIQASEMMLPAPPEDAPEMAMEEVPEEVAEDPAAASIPAEEV